MSQATATPATPATDRETLIRLASRPSWEIGNHFRLNYSGDANHIDHGGFFFNKTDWENYGYASCIEFRIATEIDDDLLEVTFGSINRPDNIEALVAETYGTEADATNADAQIECARGQWGIEPDDYQPMRTYRLAEWKEWRILKSIAPLLIGLANE